MSLILNIETSTKNCSVSIAENGITLALVEEENNKKYLHLEKLHLFIKYAIKISKINIKYLDSICVSCGPGSYSSLRIGSSAAKGLCISLGIPLLSINSLKILIENISINKGFLIPMIYAKSNQFYTSLFDNNKNILKPIILKKINNDFFVKTTNKTFLIGNFNISYLTKYFILNNYNFFIQNSPSASNMSRLSYIKFCDKKFKEIDTYSPFLI